MRLYTLGALGPRTARGPFLLAAVAVEALPGPLPDLAHAFASSAQHFPSRRLSDPQWGSRRGSRVCWTLGP